MAQRHMKAAILVEQRAPLVLEEVALPEALEWGQVLVEIVYSGICGSQLGEIEGVKGPDKYLPHLLGHEGSGVVLETGPGVKTVRPGDTVVLHWMKGKGVEAEPPVYQCSRGKLNAGWVTTFNELAVVSENRLTPIPSDCDMEIAALLGCAVTTGLGVVKNDAQVQIGESVVVLGAGGVGLNVVQGAQMASAHPIIAVDLFQNRLELAARFGASHLVNARDCDARARILEIMGGAPIDVVVDNTGSPRMIELAYELAGPSGRVILVGVPPKGQNASLHTLPLHFGKSLRGSHGGGTKPESDIPRYLGLLNAGKMHLKDLITQRFPLSEINSAIEQMRSGEIAGRCLIRMK